jgi:hypothetical protein
MAATERQMEVFDHSGLGAAYLRSHPETPVAHGWDDACAFCGQTGRTTTAEVDRLRDNPQWDATEGASPAWWRGCDHGVAAERARIHNAMLGLDWEGCGGYGCTGNMNDLYQKVLETIDGESSRDA